MNRGAEKLREALKTRGAKAAIAVKLGVKPYRVSHWLAGERTPDTRLRAALEDHLGIGWRLWDDELGIPKTGRRRKVA